MNKLKFLEIILTEDIVKLLFEFNGKEFSYIANGDTSNYRWRSLGLVGEGKLLKLHVVEDNSEERLLTYLANKSGNILVSSMLSNFIMLDIVETLGDNIEIEKGLKYLEMFTAHILGGFWKYDVKIETVKEIEDAIDDESYLILSGCEKGRCADGVLVSAQDDFKIARKFKDGTVKVQTLDKETCIALYPIRNEHYYYKICYQVAELMEILDYRNKHNIKIVES